MSLAARWSPESWARIRAMLIKEVIQLRRDRITFAMIVIVPLFQLLLFGYAINTMPRDLPTAVLLQESSDVGRSILKAFENTKYFKVTRQVEDEAEFDRVLAAGEVLFAVEIPLGFERAVRRGEQPAILVAADATDPVASGAALGAVGPIVQTALANDHGLPDSGKPPFQVRTHARYNPAASTQLNIVPGLVGMILTMTLLIFTALSVTREIERGTMVEPSLDADHPGRDHDRQDYTLRRRRVHSGRPDHRRWHRPVRRAAGWQSLAVGAAEHAVHRRQPRSGLHFVDHCAEPAPGHADGDDVPPAKHTAVRIHVSVCRHAALGAGGW
jgi:hypothetical protein